MQFSELVIGDQFKFNNIVYTKIEPQRVSCCRTLNAIDPISQNRVMIKPIEEVEKITSEQQ